LRFANDAEKGDPDSAYLVGLAITGKFSNQGSDIVPSQFYRSVCNGYSKDFACSDWKAGKFLPVVPKVPDEKQGENSEQASWRK
jgi:hypothetical protein